MNCIVRGVTKSRTQLSHFHSLPSLREAESLTFQRKIKKKLKQKTTDAKNIQKAQERDQGESIEQQEKDRN